MANEESSGRNGENRLQRVLQNCVAGQLESAAAELPGEFLSTSELLINTAKLLRDASLVTNCQHYDAFGNRNHPKVLCWPNK